MEYAAAAQPPQPRIMEQQQQHLILDMAVKVLQQAAQLTPCDARVYNNLGLALGRLAKQQQPPKGGGGDGSSSYDSSSSSTATAMVKEEEEDAVVTAYTTAHDLLERSHRAGCDVEQDWDQVRVNYGLYLSNLDRFVEAAGILEHVARKRTETSGRIQKDAHRLWEFCRRQTK
jgi:Tfp pilus assembly protein PilF